MKIKRILTSSTLVATALLVSACGSPVSDNDDGPFLGAALPQGQTASAAGTNYVALTDEELGWRAEVPDTDTANLQVYNDFTFDTSRRTKVDLSIPEAVNVSAEATFCTDYTMSAAGEYDVDYNSCVLQAPLFGGELSEELDLVNQHDKVLGIVWFQDPEMQPMYQEFHFD